MARILVVEDEKNVRDGLIDFLQSESFEVSAAENIEMARTLFAEKPDLVLLDWKLPDGQGIDLLKEWRDDGNLTPVIFLTARAELIDKVLGLEIGANDYMTKPFDTRELLARIRVQLRSVQNTPTPSENLESHGVRLDKDSHEAFWQEKKVELTRMEFDLLEHFMIHPGQVFTRDELLNKIWGFDKFPVTRTVDTHVVQLRQKFSAELIETVRGIGYRWKK